MGKVEQLIEKYCSNGVEYRTLGGKKGVCDLVAGATPSKARPEYWEEGTISWMSSGEVNKNGLPDGKGVAVFTADGQKLEGNFENGNVDGDSIHIYYADGNTFVGTFRNNQLHYGRFTWKDDGSYFVGFFTNGQPNMKKGAMYSKTGKRID